MSFPSAARHPRMAGVIIVAALGAIALALWIALRPLAVDDAYITYHYAANLAAGKGFTYNLGRPVLSTTAPLWALALAVGSLFWPDIPALANTLSAVALAAGATLLLLMGRRERMPQVGALAALLYVLYPLLWLSLGLETAVFLALSLAAILAYRSGRLYWTVALLALATMARGDGLILAAVLAADHLLHRFRVDKKATSPASKALQGFQSLWRPLAVYVVVVLPFLVWLTWRFGSPLPATLAAKRAQAELGVTGFYAHTTYLQGLGVLVRARLAQSLLYLCWIPAVVAGLVAMWRRAGWVRLLVAWGAAHLLGYTLLSVTPYYWYYAPLAPGLVAVVALGVVESVRWLGRKGIGRLATWGLGVVWAGTLLLALIRSDWAMARALGGPVPPPDDPVSKVLPEAKVSSYRLAGRWLRDNTPPGSLVGVTEVGVIGYYAERPMIDFLGLLEPDVAKALARGDLYWALLRYQPDYLALTAVSPLYAYDLRADPWFQAAYAPVQAFDDPRFWGAPVTIYERQIPHVALVDPAAEGLPAQAIRLDADFGEQIRLLGVVTSTEAVQPGDVLPLTLYWQALAPVERDYTVFVHLLGQHERVIAQRDAPPGLGAQPTSRWSPGEVIADPYLLALPEAAYAPDEAVWEVGLYDAATGVRLPLDTGADNVRFGSLAVEPAAQPLHLSFGPAVLTGYGLDRLALAPGETLEVVLHWEGDGPADVTVQMVSETGEVAARASGDLAQDAYFLTLERDAPPGAYDLEVWVADPLTGRALPLLGLDGQPRDDRARLTKVRYYP